MRFLKVFALTAVLFIAFFSCKKDSDSVDTTPDFYFITGGAGSFSNNLVLFTAKDTITYNIILSSTYIPSKEVTVMLSVADTARTSYNNANGTNYQAMPAAGYNFQTTITAGTSSVYDTIPVKFNKQFLSGADYMLPVIITSVSDYKLDTFKRIVYLHTTGDELAGIYASTGFKTLYTGDASNNNISDTSSFAITKTLVPDSATQVSVDYADLGSNGWKYELSFSNNLLTVKPNDIIKNSVLSGSFTVLASSYNPATKEIYIKTSYKNLGGDERIIEESLTLQ